MIRKIYVTEQQEETIEKLVIAAVEDICGGENTTAYHLFSCILDETLCNDLFRKFRTTSFAGILREDYKAAIIFLARWTPPRDIAEMITIDRGIMI